MIGFVAVFTPSLPLHSNLKHVMHVRTMTRRFFLMPFGLLDRKWKHKSCLWGRRQDGFLMSFGLLDRKWKHKSCLWGQCQDGVFLCLLACWTENENTSQAFEDDDRTVSLCLLACWTEYGNTSHACDDDDKTTFPYAFWLAGQKMGTRLSHAFEDDNRTMLPYTFWLAGQKMEKLHLLRRWQDAVSLCLVARWTGNGNTSHAHKDYNPATFPLRLFACWTGTGNTNHACEDDNKTFPYAFSLAGQKKPETLVTPYMWGQWQDDVLLRLFVRWTKNGNTIVMSVRTMAGQCFLMPFCSLDEKRKH